MKCGKCGKYLGNIPWGIKYTIRLAVCYPDDDLKTDVEEVTTMKFCSKECFKEAHEAVQEIRKKWGSV